MNHAQSLLYTAYKERCMSRKPLVLPLIGEPNRPIYDAAHKLVSIPEHADFFVAAANMLPRLIAAYEDLEDNMPADAHCPECTAGTTPFSFGIRTCAYHEARALLATVAK